MVGDRRHRRTVGRAQGGKAMNPRGRRLRRYPGTAGVLALTGLLIMGAPAGAQDRHVGYYYPPPQTIETYQARADTLADSDRTRRIGFVVELTAQMLSNPYPPEFAVFAKGEQAEKLMIVAMRGGVIDTVYRARALLALLTSVSRATPLFQDYGVAEVFTFFDLLKILGFAQLTISDGDGFAHQVLIE
jgi:hypothetical protein